MGWLTREAADCPATAAACAGKRDVVLAFKPGASGATLAAFPADARAFCVIDVALAPPRTVQQPIAVPVPRASAPAPAEAPPPTGSAAPPDSVPAPESPAPAEIAP